MSEETSSTHNATSSAGENERPRPLTPEEQASCDSLLDALGKIDWSQVMVACEPLIETAPDGSWVTQAPGAADGLDAEEILARGFLPPGDPRDSLPNNTDNGENAMGLLDKFRICLCSDVTGVITLGGKPVEGAEIIRRLDMIHHDNQVHTDVTVTDADGRFAFKPAYARKSKYVLWEVVTDQKLLIRHDGKLYLGWTNVSHGRDLNAEYCTTVFSPNSIKLDFDGDLSRATPLPDDVELERNMTGGGFFNSQIICVCSHLKFFVTLNGEPVQGVKVVRTADHLGCASATAMGK
jgi:hypothetical protein